MVRLALRDGDLAPHQKNAVWRILQSGSTLLAHVVAAGKTWTMTAALWKILLRMASGRDKRIADQRLLGVEMTERQSCQAPSATRRGKCRQAG
jgi:hypothetical protein